MTSEQIKEFIEEFLKKLTVDFEEVTVYDDGNNNFKFAIKSSDSGILIGTEGKNIKSLNYILKQIIRKNNQENNEDDTPLNFFIDVNDYQTKNIDRIKNKATETAEKAIVFKRNIEMDPMTSFERMLVHSVLADNPQIETESTGERNFRKVVIKYKD